MPSKKLARILPITGQKTHKCALHPEVTLRESVGHNGCWRCKQEGEPEETGFSAPHLSPEEGEEDLELY